MGLLRATVERFAEQVLYASKVVLQRRWVTDARTLRIVRCDVRVALFSTRRVHLLVD